MIWLLLLVLVYLAALLGVAWFSLHPPRIPIYLSPGALGTPQENAEFVTDDGVTLQGWWIPAEHASGVAVFSHGYFMNRSELSPLAFGLWKQGVSCLVYDFRAHGRSGGKISTMGYAERQDVAAAARYARMKAPGKPLVLIGSSMGAASSAFALAADPSLAEALVLDSAYSRLSQASLGWWRFLGGNFLAVLLAPTVVLVLPFVRFNPFKIDVADALAKIKDVPILFLHGEHDLIAPMSEAKKNQAACLSPEIVWFEKCGHSEGRWIKPQLYNEALLSFLRKVNIVP